MPEQPRPRPAPTRPRQIAARIDTLQDRLGRAGGRSDEAIQARIGALQQNQRQAQQAMNRAEQDRLLNPNVPAGPGGRRPFTSATPAQLPLIRPFIRGMDEQSDSMTALARMMGQLDPLRREREARATALGAITNQLTGRMPAGTAYGLPQQFGTEIDTAVGGQMDIQRRAAEEAYNREQQVILHNAAVQGFNPAGPLAELSNNYQDTLANIQAGGSQMRFGAAEAERARQLTRLQALLGTSEVGMQLPSQYTTALGGAFGQTSQGAAQMQNVAYTPAQLQNAMLIAQLGGGGGGGRPPAEQDSPDFWQAILGQLAGAGAQGIGAGLGSALGPILAGAGSAAVGGIGDFIGGFFDGGGGNEQIGMSYWDGVI